MMHRVAGQKVVRSCLEPPTSLFSSTEVFELVGESVAVCRSAKARWAAVGAGGAVSVAVAFLAAALG